MERRPHLFWPLVLVAAGVIWILIDLGKIPVANLWALTYLWPLLLIAAGLSLILRPYWSYAGLALSALVVAALFFSVLFAGQLGWNRVPSLGEGGAMFWASGPRGSGHVITEQRDVSGFTSVELDYPASVVIRPGTSESLTIQAEDNVVAAMSTQVEGGVLHVDSLRDHRVYVNATRPVKVTITVKSLDSVIFDSAGDLTVQGLDGQRFRVELNGAGSVSLENVKLNSLQLNLSGAGSLRASGSADVLDVGLSGLGSFDGARLQARDASIQLSGLGSADTWVTGKLSAEISGLGSVNYYGNPQVSKTVSGLGTVHSMGTK